MWRLHYLLLILVLLVSICVTTASVTSGSTEACSQSNVDGVQVCDANLADSEPSKRAGTVNRSHIVAYATSSDPNYLFYLPITAMVWKALGFEPLAIVFLDTKQEAESYKNGATPTGEIGDARARVRLAISTARKWGARVETVSLPQYGPAAPMVGRMFAACLPDLKPSSSVMLNDVDMFAFDHSQWEHRNNSNDVHYFGFMMEDPHANYWTDKRWGVQMCHVEATVKAWRKILGVPSGGCDIEQSLRHLVDEAVSNRKLEWDFDQKHLTSALRKYRDVVALSNGKDIDMHRADIRGKHKQMDGRFRKWDAATYPRGHDFTQYSSAHVPRPGFRPEQYEAVTKPLLASRLGHAQANLVDDYVRKFREML